MADVDISVERITTDGEYMAWLRSFSQVAQALAVRRATLAGGAPSEPDYERVFCHNPLCNKLQLELPKNRTEKARIKCRYCNNWNVY